MSDRKDLVQEEGVNAGSAREMAQDADDTPPGDAARRGGSAVPGDPSPEGEGTAGHVEGDVEGLVERFVGAPTSEPGYPSSEPGESGQDSGSME